MVVCVFCSDEHLTLFPGFSLLLQENTQAGHEDLCVNKFWNGGGRLLNVVEWTMKYYLG